MDCGPAALSSILAGFDLRVSYPRLREACQTSVDGTSIDTLEEVAGQLGLDAEQIMVPAEHLLLDEAKALPALVVVRLPNGNTHFVVAWRRHGPFVQLMDPGRGRRWTTVRRFESEIYRHRFRVPADAWLDWARGDEATAAWLGRLRDLGCTDAVRLLRDVASAGTWRSFAALDASIRMVRALVRGGAVRPGRGASTMVAELIRSAAEESPRVAETVPDAFWSVREVDLGSTPQAASDGQAEDQAEEIEIEGAVLVRVRGRAARIHAADDAPDRPLKDALPEELAAVLDERPSRPLRQLWSLLRPLGRWRPGVLAVTQLAAAAAVVLEALLLRGLLEVGTQMGTPLARLLTASAVAGFALLLLLLNWPLVSGALTLGRQLETRLRAAFFSRLPRLPVQYFSSRLHSDMASRSHSVHQVRDLPLLARTVLRVGGQMVFTTAGLVWLAPQSAWLAILVGLSAAIVPVLIQPLLTERDLRLRVHEGALSRFYLDGLLGLVAARTHGAEAPLRREHESLLTEWLRTGRSFEAVAVLAEGVQLLLAWGLSAALIFHYLAAGGRVEGVLLLAYWALRLPGLGLQLGQTLRNLPARRNVAARLLEPLGDLEAVDLGRQNGTKEPTEASSSASGQGVAIRFDGVTVRAAGRNVLTDVDLDIPSGGEVAIVGPSGAGKSTLVSVLLGWHRCHEGRLLVDGQELDPTQVAKLRRRTAWVDPAVQIWNRTLLRNLRYGTDEDDWSGFRESLADSDLLDLLHRTDGGLQTELGESGGLLSGGEGQRVRLGRAHQSSGRDLVILDEAFRGLDRSTRARLLTTARRKWRGATLLCVTHDLAETRDFPQVVVIDDGRIAESGAPDGLLSNEDSLYARLMKAEAQARDEFWSDPRWRHLTVDGGRLRDAREAGT